MKILNLYAGIGGNRKNWGDSHEITAVEWDPQIAEIYKQNFPQDKVIVGDAHQYLIDHYKEFDFIWASPPCPTHSIIRKVFSHKKGDKTYSKTQNKPVYPCMKLYEEIIFLDNYFEGYFAVENVEPYYEPLIEPQRVGRHCIWANFYIPNNVTVPGSHYAGLEELERVKGFKLPEGFKGDKIQTLRNCVAPELGEHILNYVPINSDRTEEIYKFDLFEEEE